MPNELEIKFSLKALGENRDIMGLGQLRKRWADGVFSTDLSSVIPESRTRTMALDNVTAKVSVFLSGSLRPGGYPQAYRHPGHAVLLCWDLSVSPHREIDNFMSEMIGSLDTGTKIFIVGINADLERARGCAFEDILDFSVQHEVEYLGDTSARTGENVDFVFGQAVCSTIARLTGNTLIGVAGRGRTSLQAVRVTSSLKRSRSPVRTLLPRFSRPPGASTALSQSPVRSLLPDSSTVLSRRSHSQFEPYSLWEGSARDQICFEYTVKTSIHKYEMHVQCLGDRSPLDRLKRGLLNLSGEHDSLVLKKVSGQAHRLHAQFKIHYHFSAENQKQSRAALIAVDLDMSRQLCLAAIEKALFRLPSTADRRMPGYDVLFILFGENSNSLKDDLFNELPLVNRSVYLDRGPTPHLFRALITLRDAQLKHNGHVKTYLGFGARCWKPNTALESLTAAELDGVKQKLVDLRRRDALGATSAATQRGREATVVAREREAQERTVLAARRAAERDAANAESAINRTRRLVASHQERARDDSSADLAMLRADNRVLRAELKRMRAVQKNKEPTSPVTSGPALFAVAEVPDQLVCPITRELMKDPVISPDGFTYERKAIQEWIKHNSSSPMTRKGYQQKGPVTLIENIALRQLIEEWQTGASQSEAGAGGDGPAPAV